MKNLLILLLLTAATHTAANCLQENPAVFATYHITQTVADGNQNVKTLNLVRDARNVAHVYPDTDITEHWFLNKAGQIKPTRYFDAHQRAIEYQPTETVHGKKETDWSYRYNLIGDDQRAKMTLVKTRGDGCQQQAHYTLKTDTAELTLVWMPALQLMQSFTLRRNQLTESWQLQEVGREPHVVAQFFATKADYQTTDYADIGDDHTDPFLTRMVTLGFIEAGASGFYDDKGHALEGGHHH